MPTLDIGAGLSPYGTVNLDIDKARYLEEWKHIHEHTWIFGVGEHLPFRDGCFETVYCMVTLPYVQSEDDVLMEIKRVLTKHGSVIIKHHSILFYLSDLMHHVFSTKVMVKIIRLLLMIPTYLNDNNHLTETTLQIWTFQTPKRLMRKLRENGLNAYCYLDRRFVFCVAEK